MIDVTVPALFAAFGLGLMIGAAGMALILWDRRPSGPHGRQPLAHDEEPTELGPELSFPSWPRVPPSVWPSAEALPRVGHERPTVGAVRQVRGEGA